MMQLASIGFLAGILICHTLAELPSKEWGWLLLLFIPLAIGFKTLRPLFFIVIGILYSLLIANDKIAEKISQELETRDLLVRGIVDALPDKTPERTRFQLQVMELSELSGAKTQVSAASITGRLPKRIQLSWYTDAPAITVGQQWQLVVRLKRPHGFSNPGGFEYESWLYQQDIHATGYVKNNSQTQALNILLGVNDSFHTRLNQLRSRISEEINLQLPENPMAGMIAALVMGDGQGIDNEQWRILTATGTNHLISISGLHIGLVAGLMFLLISQVWRRLPNAALYLSTPKAAASGAILAALGYSALAGFALPTQRALIMITVAMLAIWLQRPMIPSQILAIAVFAVLLYDPSAVINGSFWLSFGAVAIIFYTMVGRLAPSGWWWKWGRIQWMIGIGLAPLLLFWFQQVPLVSPVANLIAVPLVSFITIPLSLLGGGLLLIWPGLAHWVLVMAALTLEILWPLLDGLSRLDRLLWIGAQPPSWTLLPAIVGLLWLMAPRGMPARWAGVFWLLPLAFFPAPSLEQGMARFTLLDVGQGLAAVVQTANHVLLYDAGPRYSEQFDAGTAVVVPYLRHQGITAVDRAVLSHNDIDHTGGYQAINRQVAVRTVMQSSNIPLVRPDAEFCAAGAEWNWDGVVFKVLHPPADYRDERDNNMSCVVQIITQTDKLLLTGDMERPVEARLVKYFSHSDDNLRADILVVPHHGSRSSSSEQFVQAVTPEYALFPVGYKNRFGLPKTDVVERYQRAGARVLNSDTTGAITFILGAQELMPPHIYRAERQRFWSKINH